jgi:hypothetical protein
MDKNLILELLVDIQRVIVDSIDDQTIPALNSIQQRMDEGDNKNQLDAEIVLLKDHVAVLICAIGQFCDENQMRWPGIPEVRWVPDDDSKTE